jgi:hypothetical protein
MGTKTIVTRTVKLFGQGFGPVTELLITANGAVVHNGAVNSIPEELSDNQYTETGHALTSFEVPGDFIGQIPISITVQTGNLITTDSYYNYTLVQNPEDPENYIANSDLFGIITRNDEEVIDPKTNVEIDGITQIQEAREPGQLGEWYWKLPTGSVLTFDLNIVSAAIELPRTVTP